MKKSTSKKLQILFLGIFLSSVCQAQFKVVSTKNGQVSGTNIGEMSIFKGIPFAQPPIGDLRWKAPQAAKNWSGVRKCEAFSASPMQNNPVPFMCWTEEFIAPPQPLSEDCLYLNIWTAAKTTKDKRPVFVWIYGGGLSSGSAACAIYDGEEMAKKGIVFVSINYRVGVFGFMAHPELSKESGNNSSGNYGFLDQMAALRWIQENIGAFGGDPQNVTIAGQSAGSFSVNALVASPLAKGLFHRAIAESGGMFSNRMGSDLATAEKSGESFMQKSGAKNLAELRQKSAEELQKINLQGIRFGTVLDGYVLPKNLNEHFAKGLHNDVPLLTGWVTGDGALFGNQPITTEKYTSQAKEKYKDNADEFLKIFPANTDEEAKAMQSKTNLFQFAAFQSHLWAGFTKNKSYLYQFSHVPPDKPNFPNYGAFHTAEVPYALHTLHTWKRDWQQIDKDLEKTMSDYWVNFTKTGNPNGKGLPEWKSYDKNSGEIMELGDKVIARPALFKKEMDFLEKHQ